MAICTRCFQPWKTSFNEWLPPSLQCSEMLSHLVLLLAWLVCVSIPFRGVGAHPLALVATLYETDRRLWHPIPDECLVWFLRKTLKQCSKVLDQSCCLWRDRIKPKYQQNQDHNNVTPVTSSPPLNISLSLWKSLSTLSDIYMYILNLRVFPKHKCWAFYRWFHPRWGGVPS